MASKKKIDLVSVWLIILSLSILIMITVGGLTRLTESGLSMVDWNLFLGAIPPMSENSWQKLFEDYQNYPEYKIKNLHMTLHDFKFIFWWEYIHRMIGRLIGILFLIPFVFFVYKKYLTKKELRIYLILFLLGGIQGFIGWWMVKSGLDLNPYVNHFRLAIHLIMAQLILSIIFYLLLNKLIDTKYSYQTISHKKYIVTFNFIILLTVIYGAFMAGLDAGLSFNTWPLMGDRFIPENLFFIEEKFYGVFDNTVFIHFFHRLLAYFSIFVLVIIVIKFINRIDNPVQKKHLLIISLLVFLQIIFGIFVVLSGVQVALGSIHQILGTLVLVGTTAYSLKIFKS